MKRSGYLLLETVLALSIFVVAVVGLVQTLNAALDADYEQRRQTIVRVTMQNLLDAGKVLPRGEIEVETEPDAFGIVYQRSMEEAAVRLRDGTELNGLIRLKVEAIDPQRENRVIGTLETYVGAS